MKYLKSYKVFESNWYDIKDHIKVLSDMSLPLWDRDFNVQVSDEIIPNWFEQNSPLYKEKNCVVVNVCKRRFTYSEIREELYQMIDYMNREGWKIYEMTLFNSEGRDIYCEIDSDRLVNMSGEEITYEISHLILKFSEKEEVKTNESTEEDVHREMMIKKYGEEEIEECDEVIRMISNMALEVEDLGITVLVEYSPMTYMSFESTPKISVSVIADEKLFAGKIADIDIFTDTLLGYVKSLGFSTGKNTFTSDDRKLCRQILIQK